MAEVTETQLPGVGVRYEFKTGDKDHVGVVHHHSGRREIVVYDRKDPDVARSVLELSADDSRTLSDLLGASHTLQKKLHSALKSGQVKPVAGEHAIDAALIAKYGRALPPDDLPALFAEDMVTTAALNGSMRRSVNAIGRAK